ncbi:hypothetical protein Poli38472_006761 [Pythium oligandrum]|uniref:Uncharacterized protein n=1 Tax=Pythium oligandrum TaxID=41045 RepID=A0A8K1C563_PYTOL|nr:hypothetical protein Poli38472_006761 [Pythium oligandrum]|eukprot:TMW56751.1 hypothetical protein Poli38472_006761 [Pythium oligandrum]
MRFFRSDRDAKQPKQHHRFSFRRHSEDTPDALVDHKARHHHQQTQIAQRTHSRRPAAHSAPAPPQNQQLKPPAHDKTPQLASTFVSTTSTSTSASSATLSPSPLHKLIITDTTLEDKKPAKRPSDSGTSTETEDSEFVIGTPGDDVEHDDDDDDFLTTPRDDMIRRSRVGSGSGGLAHAHAGGGVSRSSLAGYRQLEFSMSYKNRMGAQTDDTSSLSASFIGVRRSETGGHPRTNSTSSSRSSSSFIHSNASTAPTSTTHAAPSSSRSQTTKTSSNNSSTREIPSSPAASTPASASGSPSKLSPSRESEVGARMSDVPITEASVAALQTRRALQQMVLAMEDEDSDDDDSDNDFGPSSESSGGIHGIIQLGADDYRKFQFRLKQLEDICHDQARKQAHMEESIEQEVQARTKKVVEAMEKKISMYKQAKDLEVEREIQRRVSEMSTGSSSRGSSTLSSRDSFMSMTPQYQSDPRMRGKPLDKIFHPRRTRRRMELIRQHEEQQKREMEQFREFIRSTERSTEVGRAMGGFYNDEVDAESARETIKALHDPHITEDLLDASQNELIDIICVLRKHVSVQDEQLDQAKRLIVAAIEAREEAESTAREAMELTIELDSRLERASHEIVVIRDELRRSSEISTGAGSFISPPNASYAALRSASVPAPPTF